MLALSLLITLGLSGLNDPPKSHDKPKAAPAVPESHGKAEAKEAHGAEKPAKGGREEEPKAKAKNGHGEEKAAAHEEEEAPKPKPKPVVRRKPVPKPAPAAHAAPPLYVAPSSAEMRAAQLTEENARLQQELARRQGLSLREPASPDEAVAELAAGNERFVSGKRVRTLLAMQDVELRDKLSKGQAPFAIVVTCSDSRLADNVIFDQELGRLFTIREAGNSPDTQGIASAEYAADHLGSKVIVVMGHSACGAVKAVKEAHGSPLPGNLWIFQAAMAGLLETVHPDPNESASGQVNRLAIENAKRQAAAMLARSEILRKKVEGRALKIVPAFYDLASGKVSFYPAVTAAAAPEGGHH